MQAVYSDTLVGVRRVGLAPVELPDIPAPTFEPELPAAEYEKRLAAALERMHDDGLDVLLVYGDREHIANLTYLIGFDPRFEEALLILDRAGNRTLLLGNEGMGYADICPIEIRRELFQSFSLIDMPRGESRALRDILTDRGLAPDRRVGLVGWKYFDTRETDTPAGWLDLPAFVVDTVRDIVGKPGDIVNAAALFMHPQSGLRTTNSVEQLATFEFAAWHASEAVRRVLFGLRPGMTEHEAVQLMQLNGLPLNCHVMLSAGSDTSMLMRSPRLRRIQYGETFFVAHGLRGALNARAGFLIETADELPSAAHGYIEDLVAPYFAAVVEWYERLRIGATGGELRSVVDAHAGAFRFGLTPGQLIHLEEWLSSPFLVGSSQVLRSGMLIQSDFIPSPYTAGQFTTNIEDTLALADAELRAAFEAQFPEAWNRIQRRRRFVIDVLGIHIAEEVLPFSNIACFLPPFLLDPHTALIAQS